MASRNNKNNQLPPATFTNQDIEAYTKWVERVVAKYRGEIKTIKTEWVVFKNDAGVVVGIKPELEIEFNTMEDVALQLESKFESTSAPVNVESKEPFFDSTKIAA